MGIRDGSLRKKAESCLLLAACSPRLAFSSLTSEFSPLDIRLLARYNTVQAKCLPKQRWLSKLFLSGMEVVIDDFCLLFIMLYLYQSPCFLIGFFFPRPVSCF